MKTYKDFLIEKKVTEKDIVKAIKKDRSRQPSVLLLINYRGRETHVSVDLDAIKNKDGNSYFGTDEDGNEIEFEIKDVSRIE